MSDYTTRLLGQDGFLLFRTTTHVANKDHVGQCYFCGQTIAKGQEYERAVGMFDFQFGVAKSHADSDECR